MPENWNLETKLPHGTIKWKYIVDGCILTFIFGDDCPYIDLAFQIVKNRIYENVTPLTWKQPA